MQQSYEDPAQSEHEALKMKIEEWLDAEGITFKNAPDLNSYFHIVAGMKNTSIHVNESKVRRGCLVVQGIMALGPDQLAKIEKVKDEEKRSLFLSMFYLLDKSEYHFMIQEDFYSQSWVKVQRTLYIEDLSRTALLNAMKDLDTKIVNINYAMNEALGYIVPVSTDSPVYT